MIGEMVLCECGCKGTFVKRSAQHIYKDGPACRRRNVRRLIRIGVITPSSYNECEICQESIPVYKQLPGSANRLTCSDICKQLLEASRNQEDFSRPSMIKPHRQDYCRQDGECDFYGLCLDLGAKKKWPRDRGEECFKKRIKPLRSYDQRSAIQMDTHPINEQKGN